MTKFFWLFLLTVGMAAHAENAEGPEQKFVVVGISDASGSSLSMKFLPPGGSDWQTKSTGTSVTLKKTTNSEGDSREIEAYLLRLDTPIEPIARYMERVRKNTVEGYANSKEFKISALEVTEDTKDSRCVKVYLLLEALKPDPATQQQRWSEQYALSCGLLKYKGLGFELRYYHRYIDQNKNAQFGEEANKVLVSVVLEEIRKTP